VKHVAKGLTAFCYKMYEAIISLVNVSSSIAMLYQRAGVSEAQKSGKAIKQR